MIRDQYVGADVHGVQVMHWNPRRPFHGRPRRLMQWGMRLPWAPRVRNFGDLLGPQLTRAQHGSLALGSASKSGKRLLTVGSILHFAEAGDVAWGTGVNGNAQHVPYTAELDVRAVRGPLTREFLLQHGVEHVPEVYGDPGLLVPQLLPPARTQKATQTEYVVIPNLNELERYREHRNFVSPVSPLASIVDAMLGAELVVGTSLHGIIVAEAFGIPARLVLPGSEHRFKYEDYYLGTGRPGFTAASSVEEALTLGGEPPIAAKPDALLASFPRDLWIS
ncbi:polysaccharide pyruvyl transferase family protein [Pseudoclavibacter sp. RFBA6]|uniref:polysaccharide pyruvyl transferase family protein n=1 Tax=Pseudoclavibacter sp. RFBA6 TaxID=2080573 RepID=UPI000CE76D37|nr:polysaccharide pyruvyl transferase family protein [Pseudoclavibacter sp. RFBA6]PPG42718.1 pyruvyl transferase [Pseudoclavibacter sp. RFBA6]